MSPYGTAGEEARVCPMGANTGGTCPGVMQASWGGAWATAEGAEVTVLLTPLCLLTWGSKVQPPGRECVPMYGTPLSRTRQWYYFWG